MRIVKLISIGFALSLGLGLVTMAADNDSRLRRIACVDLMVFAPQSGVSDADTCRAHGGLASEGAEEAKSGLVILVRNRPVGAANGLDASKGS
ncbi:antitermination protein [Stappia taiwanensis]|uniref:Antitermination protein n=1 Tax=Stappia taiwanensis TaxID=992267 RepID=A0A838XKX1_9HYPH|nr:antitermination protein [Stappia taiwanensis]MBA4610497.1 antitermination protein [Stappia taiwanensis]GGE84421.1 hypothetical protein GCM10007285_10070 [Stappia taiwanensis]